MSLGEQTRRAPEQEAMSVQGHQRKWCHAPRNVRQTFVGASRVSEPPNCDMLLWAEEPNCDRWLLTLHGVDLQRFDLPSERRRA